MPVIAGRVERLLCEGVAAAVASVRPLSAVYCVILSYTDEAFLDAWPPFLVLGTEAYRERMRREHPDELPYYLWAPDEMRGAAENIELELSDPSLLEKCGIHCELMKVRNSDASGRKVVRDAAIELAKRDWATQMPISDDFVVVAVDNSGGVDPIKDMKKVLAPAAFQKLKKRGWA
jgi:hypothetical protein